MSEIKAGRAQVKATNEATGTFTAVVAVFDVVDSYFDVIRKGAFSGTLAEWADSGDSIPVLWSHDKDDVDAHIGVVVSAAETDEGLEVECQLDMDNPTAAKVHKLLKGRRIREFSFGFFIREAAEVELEGQYVRELRDVELIEVSPTLVGANRSTRLVGVKSADDGAAPVVSLAPADRALLSRLVKALEAPAARSVQVGDDSGILDGEAEESADKGKLDAAASELEEPDEGLDGVKSGEDQATAAAILDLATMIDS